MADGKEQSFNFLKSIGQMKGFATYEDYHNKDNPNWEKNKDDERWKQEHLKTDEHRRIFASWDNKSIDIKDATPEEQKHKEEVKKENDESEKLFSQLFPKGLNVSKNK